MEQQRLFSNQRLIRLIIPLVIEQGLTILVGMCDGVMVSSVGEAAISGVSLVDMINAVVLILFAALATGGAVVTSQFLGARQMEKAKKSAGQLVLMAGVLGSVSAVLCIVFANGLMKLAAVKYHPSYIINRKRISSLFKFMVFSLLSLHIFVLV